MKNLQRSEIAITIALPPMSGKCNKEMIKANQV